MESFGTDYPNRLETMTKTVETWSMFRTLTVFIVVVAYNHNERKRFNALRDVEARETYTFDSIDLIAMEIYGALLSSVDEFGVVSKLIFVHLL